MSAGAIVLGVVVVLLLALKVAMCREYMREWDAATPEERERMYRRFRRYSWP